ncbi:isochorismatase family cysteine hydrolase [Burkholderia ubonensis]|uniref:isochorismatase family cysteine hydrolase n=1 Tax=Burkholderia ubonensis TaxID=101571 RepID=UPI00075ECCDA|nr:isochorismatase family cysteine hydrolase [Burkholderia ubonensis]KVL70452.1 isochorismatase [Burkholderia ubonensis]KVL73315.1 isochorismatase [Burkholderia ubonensis]KVL91142.1 isochorismatase [Burkholderia ubonensis]
MSKIAILTNDLQYDLVRKNAQREAAVKEFLPKFSFLLNAARKREVPVIHLQLINDPNDPNAEAFDDGLPVQKGTKGAEILAELFEPTDILMEKNKDSGFFETDLDRKLKELSVDTVIITGMQAQICVQTTAADAFFRGYNVVVPPDGVVSTSKADVDRSIAWLDSYCASIIPIDEIVRKIGANEVFEKKQIRIN